MRVISCKSTSKALAVCSFIMVVILAGGSGQSAEAAGDVVLGAPVARRREHVGSRTEFDQLAEIHERGEVGNAGGLLHIVSDDHNRIVALQFVDQLLDLSR